MFGCQMYLYCTKTLYFFCEISFAMLDQPGEFACVYLGNGQSEFQYIPMDDGEDSPIFSNLEVLLQMNRATNINVKGIKFEHTASRNIDGYNWGTDSAVRILNALDINFEDCQFSHIGENE